MAKTRPTYPGPVTSPQSSEKTSEDDRASSLSTPSSSAHVFSSSSSSSRTPTSSQSAVVHSKTFVIPDTWRPLVMVAINAPTEAEKRRQLTPNVRNAIVRDLMTTMYAFMPKPNKNFCTEVAQKLVEKYTFMRDAGTNVSGYVSQFKFLAI